MAAASQNGSGSVFLPLKLYDKPKPRLDEKETRALLHY